MIEIVNINKSFEGKQIIKNMSFTVKDGEILTIVGPSGGGKTTLLRCISGLETIDSGEVRVDGLSVDRARVNKKIGVVFQDFNLFPHFSVIDNITLAPISVLHMTKDVATNEAMSLLASFGLQDKASQYPFELSGGQKQRVAIARALIMKPKVLCYDEPTSALDPELRDNVADLILQLKKEDISQIIVTHDIDFGNKISDFIIEVEPIKGE